MVDQTMTPGFRFYQSANTDAAIIKEDFIIRLQEFNIIMEDVRRNPMNGSVQHYLLIGRRGSGKSTLLRRIQAEIESDKKLSKTHVAINLAEEQANIYRLHDLLEEIIQELEHEGISISLPEWDDDEQKYSRELFKSIHTAIEKSKKKIVLLLDNIDRIFENLHDDAALLREYLLNFDDIKIVGGSTKMTEHFWQYNKPFYEFFRVLELKKLTSEEVRQLLLYWAEKLKMPQLKEFVENKSGQIETVRILTDGLPRTLQFFVNILLTRTQESGYEYLRLIMDQVTPLYQERLNALPPAQRKVILKLAFIWEAAGAKDIAAATHMENKLVSAQLKQLSDKGIVERLETKTKNHLYRLAERFFNLWLIFTQGNPHEKRKAKCLTIFLENFYDAHEFKEMAMLHISILKEGKLSPNKAAILTKAYAQSKFISFKIRDELIINTLEIKGIDKELMEQLPQTTNSIWKKICDFINVENWNKAIEMANDIVQVDGAREFMLGYIYFQKNDYLNSEKYYLMSVEKGHLNSLCNLGSLYFIQNKLDFAERYLKLSAATGDGQGMYNLAGLYLNQNKIDLAEEYYLKAIDKKNIGAINNLAVIYENEGRLEMAEKYYLLAIKEKDVFAYDNLAGLYLKQGKLKEAEKYYLLSIKNEYWESLFNLANFYSDQKEITLAEKYYLLSSEKGNYKALNNLAVMYYESNINKELAFEYIQKAQALSGDDEIVIASFIAISLWVGKFYFAVDRFNYLLKSKMLGFFEFVISSFLIHKQTNFLLDFFEKAESAEDIIASNRPIYYAALVLGKNDNSINLKMPPELKETVNIIVNDIKSWQERYYGNN